MAANWIIPRGLKTSRITPAAVSIASTVTGKKTARGMTYPVDGVMHLYASFEEMHRAVQTMNNAEKLHGAAMTVSAFSNRRYSLRQTIEIKALHNRLSGKKTFLSQSVCPDMVPIMGGGP